MHTMTPTDRELRERCLELAVKAEPGRAVGCAREFVAFVTEANADCVSGEGAEGRFSTPDIKS